MRAAIMPAEAIAANTIAGKGFPASNRLWYIRNPKKVATRAAPDPNVTRSNMRPEIRRNRRTSPRGGSRTHRLDTNCRRLRSQIARVERRHEVDKRIALGFSPERIPTSG